MAKARVDLAISRSIARIAAPFDSVVGARYVAPGDLTDKKALVRIDAIDRLRLSSRSASRASRSRAGSEARGARASISRQDLSGEVFFVSPSLDRRPAG